MGKVNWDRIECWASFEKTVFGKCGTGLFVEDIISYMQVKASVAVAALPVQHTHQEGRTFGRSLNRSHVEVSLVN